MIQMLISLTLPFVLALLKLLIKDPTVAAAEASAISELAQYATQADTIVNNVVWTSTPGTPASKSAALKAMQAKLG
jgi:hypothetical protein